MEVVFVIIVIVGGLVALSVGTDPLTVLGVCSGWLVIICVLPRAIQGWYDWGWNVRKWFHWGEAKPEEKPPKQKFPPPSNEPNRHSFAELIWQQEQTNRHLQKLISDFFWFRIGIIGLFVVGVIFGSGGFN